MGIDFTRCKRALWIGGALCAIASARPVAADDFYQSFETWTGATSFGSHSENGWELEIARVSSATIPAQSGTLSGQFNKDAGASLRTPFNTNGVGELTYYAYARTVEQEYVIRTSTNGTDWVVVATNTTTPAGSWQFHTLTINEYKGVYLQIYRHTSYGNGQLLALDEVRTTTPDQRVDFVDVRPDPDPPEFNNNVDITATITPSSLVSNLVVTSFWRIGASPFAAIGMTNTAGNDWITTNKIPAQPGGTVIDYYLAATFDGTNGLSPTNFPAGGESAPTSYTVQERQFISSYDNISASNVVSGETTAMVLIDDVLWQGVVEYATNIVDADFRYYAVLTNNAATNIWGDTDQADFVLPIVGVADAGGGANIDLDGTNTGQIVFRVNESNLDFSVRQAAYNDFEDWSGAAPFGDYTNDGWAAIDASITVDDDRKLRGDACYLDKTSNAYIRTPYLPDGIGEIHFFYRNYDTNSPTATDLLIQKSKTGGSDTSEWTTIDTIATVLTTNYTPHSITNNDRFYNYVRIVNDGIGARLCIDELLVAYPGAGLAFTNEATDPVKVVVTNTVDLYVDVVPLAGASNIVPTLYYRGGTTGVFTAIGMTNTTGNTFVTTNLIPAGIGPDDGAGIVQYYLDTTFMGYQANLASPTLYPEGGSNNPTSYFIVGAEVGVSNGVTVPASVVADTLFDLAVNIFPSAASNIVVTSYYRFGDSGPFTPVSMSTTGANYYVSDSSISAPSAPGTPIDFYFATFFEGPAAVSPTLLPTGGPGAPFRTLTRAPALASAYDSMEVTGTKATNINLTADEQWQGVMAATNGVTDYDFSFRGIQGATTNTWGDASQDRFAFPFFGVAGLGEADIELSGSHSNQFVFRFHETNLEYSVERAAYQDFSQWSTAGFETSTNDALVSGDHWVASDAWVTTNESTRQLRGAAAYLESNTVAYVRSPMMPEGIGEISFWYRNWEIDGSLPTTIRVQTSVDGIGGWQTAATITNVLTRDFLFFSTRLAAVNDRYVRIANVTNSPNARLALDEITITYPAATVAMSNLTHSPLSPTATNTVSVSIDITPQESATNIVATAWYRSGVDAYASIGMTNTVGDTYVTISPIPAAAGPDDGGAGPVDYYVSAAFGGFGASAASPTEFPLGGPTNPAVYVIVPARVVVTNVTTVPSPPLTDAPIDIVAHILPIAAASNIVATSYYRLADSGPFTPLTMTTTGGNYFVTSPSIPAQLNPGTPLEYYINIHFEGPSALTPTNFPIAGAAAPIHTVIRAAPLQTAYDTMAVTGTEATNIHLVDDDAWQGVITATGGLNNYAFTYEGVAGAATSEWGVASQSISNFVFFGTSVVTALPITLFGNYSNQFVFRFNESDLSYSVEQAAFQDFSQWATAGFETSSNSALVASHEWVAVDAWVTTDEASRQLRGAAAYLESNSIAYVRSPYMPDGIGEISFWYRNWETNGTDPTAVIVQTSPDGSTGWQTIATVTNILTPDFVFFNTRVADRVNHYVRVLNATNGASARLALDELTISYPGAGVVVTNLSHSPASPNATNTVDVSATIIPLTGASNIVATAWYRAGTNAYASTTMTTTGGNYYVTSPSIPAGVGPEPNVVNFVDYYVSATFSGFAAELASPTLSDGGSNSPAQYFIVPPKVSIANVVTVPDPPLTGTNINIRADISPINAASNISATAYYRLGTSGGFAGLAMSNIGGDTFETSTPIPAQTHPGTPLQYYITATFLGPSAQSPTNFPIAGAGAPIHTVIRQGPFASSNTSMVVTGTSATNIYLVADNLWQGVLTSVGGITNYAFVYRGVNGPITNDWGDADQDTSAFAFFGEAEEGAADVVLNGVHSGHFLFRINESNLEYSVEEAAHQNFEAWSTAGFETSSNSLPIAGQEWVAVETWVTTNEATRQLRGSAAYLESNTVAYVRSPNMPGGLGEISFWYRNWETNGTLPTTIKIEKSIDGVSGWQSIDTVTNVLSPDFVHYSTRLSDRDYHYVRIANVTNSPNARLALDEISVTAPGAGVAMSNLVHSPAAPTMTNTVGIAVDLYPLSGATNLQATAYFRAGGSGPFDARAMQFSGGNNYTTITNIPQLGAGVVEYYVAVAFDGFGSEESSPSFFPTLGPLDPRAYTNLAASAGSQDFEDWTDAPGFGLHVSGGWVLNNGRASASLITPHEGSLLSGQLREHAGSYLRTPQFNDGVGTLTFYAHGRLAAVQDFQVRISTDTVEWDVLATISVSPVNQWVGPIQLIINSYSPVYVDFYREEAAGNLQFLALDDIQFTLPPARVAFGETRTIPGYPASNDTVDVSAIITNIYPTFPAVNIRSKLYYREKGVGPWLGPLAMDRDGDRFETSTPIPTYPAQTEVEYYFESDYSGHDDGQGFSPERFPADAPSTTFSYTVRFYKSDYLNMLVSPSITGFPDVVLTQVNDYNWEGLVLFESPVTDPAFIFTGKAYDVGTNASPGTTDHAWGDNDQDRFHFPQASNADRDEGGILATGSHTGQIIVRFDERTEDYVLMRAAFQDFDSWTASDPAYFDTSIDNPNAAEIGIDFNDCGLTIDTNRIDDFQSWSTNGNYEAFLAAGTKGFVVHNARIMKEGLNKFCEFDPNIGVTADMHSEGSGATRTTGIGSYSLSYRAREETTRPITDFANDDASWTNYMVQAVISASSNHVPGQLNMISRYGNNEYYIYQLEQTAANLLRVRVLRRHANGTTSQLKASGSFAGNLATPGTARMEITYTNSDNDVVAYYNGVPRVSTSHTSAGANYRVGSIGFFGFDADMVVEDVLVSNSEETLYTTNAWVSSADWNDPDGRWAVSGGDYGQTGLRPPLEFVIEVDDDLVPPWEQVGELTGITDTNFATYSLEVHTNATQWIRVRHSGGTWPLIVDDVNITEWKAVSNDCNGWVANEARVTTDCAISVQSLEFNESKADIPAPHYLLAPKLTNGLATIDFRYLSTNTASFRIETSTDLVIWSIVGGATNDTGGVPERFFLLLDDPTSNMYMRIVNTTAGDNKLIIDDVVLTDFALVPDQSWLSYNMLITDDEDGKIFRGSGQSGFLNDSFTDDVLPVKSPLSAKNPELLSPFLPNGIGEISFWYRNWDATDGMMSVEKSPDGTNWVSVTTVTADSSEYQFFKTELYDRDNHYVRFVNTMGGNGRVSLDHIVIGEPLGASVTLSNLVISPAQPLDSDAVTVNVTVFDHFLNPQNIVVTNWYRVNTGAWQAVTMTEGAPGQYSAQIPAQDVDDYVEYYAAAYFDGTFSEFTSPQTATSFTWPSWYDPIPKPTNYPAYYVYSVAPGAVWINAVKYAEICAFIDLTEYVELAGPAGAEIQDWTVEIVKDSAGPVPYAWYSVTNGTPLPDDTGDGAGFWVLGDAEVANVDMLLTTIGPDGLNLPRIKGGARLFRSNGALEYAVWYGAGTPAGYDNIGSLACFQGGPIDLRGTGSGYSDFTWSTDGTVDTPGGMNDGQTIDFSVPDAPDVALDKTGTPYSVSADSNLVYTLSVSNKTADLIASLVVTDTLPAQVTFVSSAPPPTTQNGQTNTYTLVNLAASNSTSIVIQVFVNAWVVGAVTNTATVAVDGETNVVDNLASATNLVPDAEGDGDPDFADEDDDNDGMSDADEGLADTDPLNADSLLMILGITSDGANATITWKGGVLATQYLERSTGILPGEASWTAISTNAPPTAITNMAVDPDYGSSSNAYYRVKANQ